MLNHFKSAILKLSGHNNSQLHRPAAHNDKDERVTATMVNAFAVTGAASV